MSSKAVKSKAKAVKINPTHRSAWRSMRILREWSIPGIVRTIPGATVAGISRYVKSLERHSIVEKLPGYKKGRAGDHQRYRIYAKLSDQPLPPQFCHLCDQLVSAKVCDPSLKETHRETEPKKGKGAEKRAQALREKFATMPELTMEELERAEAELFPKKERETDTDKESEPAAAEYPNEGWHVVPNALKRRLSGGLHDAT